MQLFHAANLTDVNAPLQALALGDLADRLRTDTDLRDELTRLRRVKAMDLDAFKRLKTRLPIFCCGTFREGVRRTANFESIAAFVLDIDHFSGNMAELAALRSRLTAADDRIALAFVSPGGDGLKLLFGMDKACTDTKRFSDFYKAFAYEFGERHGLTAYIDFRTSDATRVCFMSFDSEAYYDPISTPVCWGAYLPEAVQPMLSQARAAAAAQADLFASVQPAPAAQGGADIHSIGHGFLGDLSATQTQQTALPRVAADIITATTTSAAEALTEHPNRSHQIRPDVFREILTKLQVKARPNPLQREVSAPSILGEVIGPVRAALAAAENIAAVSVRDIQYGKQLELRCGMDMVGMNIFYGKRGFSVVVVPRQNANLSLGELCKFVAEQVIFGMHEWYDAAAQSDVLQNAEAGFHG